MQRLRLSVACGCLQLPLKQSLRRAAELGVSAMQFDARNELKPSDFSETGCRQLLHAMSEMRLAVASLDFPTRRPLQDSDQLDARIHALKEAMRLAARLKSSVVTARIGTIPAETDSDEYELLLNVLNDLARHGNHVGVTLSITTGRNAAESLAQLAQRITEGPLGVNFDPAALVTLGESPTQAYRSLYTLVAHVRARDAVREAGLGREVPLGRGEVPWDELLALFDESAYAGWVTIDRTEGNDKPGDAARAVQYLKNIAMG